LIASYRLARRISVRFHVQILYGAKVGTGEQNMLGRATSAVLIVGVTAFGSTSCSGVPPRRLAEPVADPGRGTATLSVHRRNAVYGSGPAYPVLLDGQAVARLLPGETTTVQVPAGNHEVRVQCVGGTGGAGAATELVFGAGRSYLMDAYQTSESECVLRTVGG
jgi:hypothetical protein